MVKGVDNEYYYFVDWEEAADFAAIHAKPIRRKRQ